MMPAPLCAALHADTTTAITRRLSSVTYALAPHHHHTLAAINALSCAGPLQAACLFQSHDSCKW